MRGYVSILSTLKTQLHWEMLLALSFSLSGFYRPGKPVTRKLLFLLNLSLTDQTQTQPQHRITHKTPVAMDEAHAAH